MTVASSPGQRTPQSLPPPRVRRYRNDSAPRGKVSTAVIYIIVAVLVASVGLLYLVQTNHVASLGYEMSRLQQERAELASSNETLNYQVAQYEAITRVEHVAVNELGMRESTSYLFLKVQRPASDQLPLIQPDVPQQPGLIERIWHGLTGSSVAVSEPGGE